MDFGVHPRPKALRKWPRLIDKAVLHVEKLVDRYRYPTWYELCRPASRDWTLANFLRCRHMIGVWRKCPFRILEVGTYEGRASIFILRSTFVGIDWFEGELGAPAAARLPAASRPEMTIVPRVSNFGGSNERPIWRVGRQFRLRHR